MVREGRFTKAENGWVLTITVVTPPTPEDSYGDEEDKTYIFNSNTELAQGLPGLLASN